MGGWCGLLPNVWLHLREGGRQQGRCVCSRRSLGRGVSAAHPLEPQHDSLCSTWKKKILDLSLTEMFQPAGYEPSMWAFLTKSATLSNSYLVGICMILPFMQWLSG